MNSRALLFDPTEEYVNGSTLTFRTAAGDVKRVLYAQAEETPRLMSRVSSDTYFDYWSIDFDSSLEQISFCFIAETDEDRLYYDCLGASCQHDDNYNFVIYPHFAMPMWSQGAIMYQIFVDRFFNGNPDNDVKDNEYRYLGVFTKHKDWEAMPEEFDVANFYGGDLEGVIEKLDYLKALGVEAIYLNPIFTSPSNHKYDIEDYYSVDKHFGGNEVFAKLCSEIHSRGMKVILDGVFNHCSERNKWMQHSEYFKFNRNGDYECWWDNITLPKLNYEESSELQEEVLKVAQYWLKEPYCIDGWRLDVAADLGHSEAFNHFFWKRFRNRVKAVNPEAVIIAEHYGDARAWLKGNEWDTVMNYDGFMDPVSSFLTGMEKHSDRFDENKLGNAAELVHAIQKVKASMSMPSILAAMNEIDNHDHSRFLTRTNHVAGRLDPLVSEDAKKGTNICFLRQAQLMQMSLQGSPTFYYGDEAGVTGFTDPDSRRTYPWGKEDPECIEWAHIVSELHKSSDALRRGSLNWLIVEKNLVVYSRTLGKEKFIIVIHTGDDERDIVLPVWMAGITEEDKLCGVLYTDCWNYGEGGNEVKVENGQASLRIKPHGGYVLKTK